MGKTKIRPPKLVKILQSSVESSLDKYKMDVELETSVGKIFIEVKVTADCSGEKVSYIKSNKVPTLEVDLSQFLEQPPDICKSNALLQMGQTSNSGSDEMKKRGSLFYPARVILFDTL